MISGLTPSLPQDTGIVCGETSASLTGQTFGGQAIEGSDSISTVPAKWRTPQASLTAQDHDSKVRRDAPSRNFRASVGTPSPLLGRG